MRTVLMHFYNEQYLLPWWLKHHVELFDHGVLIDYASTDESPDICRRLAPHWKLVQSQNAIFDEYDVDYEVMEHEAQLPGWKMVLNTTEFLCVRRDDLLRIEDALSAGDWNGTFFEAIV